MITWTRISGNTKKKEKDIKMEKRTDEKMNMVVGGRNLAADAVDSRKRMKIQ